MRKDLDRLQSIDIGFSLINESFLQNFTLILTSEFFKVEKRVAR